MASLSTQYLFTSASLLLWTCCCIHHGKAEAPPDLEVAEAEVELLSHLDSALKIQLSMSEHSIWNASMTPSTLLCIDDMMEELFIQPPFFGDKCGISISYDANDGSGFENDTEDSIIQPKVASEVFCNDTCHSTFISAYNACGVFNNAIGRQVKNVLGGLCIVSDEKEVCLEILTRFAPDPQLTSCLVGKDCSRTCKQKAEETSAELGCCLRTEGRLGSEISELLTDCNIQRSQMCKETVIQEFTTDTAEAISSFTFTVIPCFVVASLYFH